MNLVVLTLLLGGILLQEGSAMVLSNSIPKLKTDLWQLNYEIENIKKEILKVCPENTIVFNPKVLGQLSGKESVEGLQATIQIRHQTHQRFLQIYINCLTGGVVPTAPTTPSLETTRVRTTRRITPHFTTTTRRPTTAQPTTTTQPSTTPTIIIRNACRFAINLTQEERTDQAGSRFCPDGGSPLCDLRGFVESGRPWFRFTESAGRRLLNRFPPVRSCGTDAPIWSDDQPGSPTTDAVHGFDAYAHWRFDTKYKTVPMQLINCGNNDIIYQFTGTEVFCNSAFCGMN